MMTNAKPKDIYDQSRHGNAGATYSYQTSNLPVVKRSDPDQCRKTTDQTYRGRRQKQKQHKPRKEPFSFMKYHSVSQRCGHLTIIVFLICHNAHSKNSSINPGISPATGSIFPLRIFIFRPPEKIFYRSLFCCYSRFSESHSE